MKKAINILKWVLLIGYFPIILSFVSVNSRQTRCIDVCVIVRDSLQAGFLNSKDVRATILENYPDILGGPVKNVDFNEMEAFVNEHPVIRSSEVYHSAGGILCIQIEQYQPVLRVFGGDGTYYLDETGYRIPVSSNFTAHVIVANGNIPSDQVQLTALASYIARNPFWKAQLEQIYIRRNNDYILIPRVGDHWILLGRPENFEQKLNNLMALYNSGLNPKEWNEYLLINLKFKDQVICSRQRNL